MSVLIWHCMTQIIVSRNFLFISSYPLSSPSSSLLSLQILSLPLFPPSPIIYPFSQAWLDLKLHLYHVLSTVYYYHPLELRSKLLVLEPPVLTSVSVLCMHLCIHLLFPRLVLVFHLKLHGTYQSYQFTALSLADI